MLDENNRLVFLEFICKFIFVVKKVWLFIGVFVNNIGEGFFKIIDFDSGFFDRVGGLGQMMFGIIGLKYLMNLMSIIIDILSVLDLFGNQVEKFIDVVGDVDEKNKKKKRRVKGIGGDFDVGLDKDGKFKFRSGFVDNLCQSGINKFFKVYGNEVVCVWVGVYDNVIKEGLILLQVI